LNTFFAPRFRLGWVLLVVGALSSLGAFCYRWNFENQLSSVQITIDYDDTRNLADAYQTPNASLLAELKERGVSSIALYQQTLGGLSSAGRLNITPRDEAQRLYPQVKWSDYPIAYRFFVTAPPANQDLWNQIKPRLIEQAQRKILPVTAVPLPGVESTTGEGLLVPASVTLRNDAVLGFDPASVRAIQKAGLIPTARLSNALNLNVARLNRSLDDCVAIGAKVVIFSEDEVVGYDSMIPEVSRAMAERHLIFGNIEFTKQRGWEDFAKRTEGMVVRVHSIGGDEAAKAKTHLLVDRFARAVKERDVRVAYVRLVRQFKGEYDATSGVPLKSALQQNLDFVQSIRDEIRATPLPILRAPLGLGAATPFANYPLDSLETRFGHRGAMIARYLSLFCAGLGALGAALLLLNLFFDLSPRAYMLLTFVGLAAVAGLSLSSGIGAKAIGLLAGVCVAPVAVLWGGLPRLWERIDDERPPTGYDGRSEHLVSAGRAFARGFVILAQTTLIAFMGALLVVAAYNHWKYLSHSDEFVGEKATLLFPPLLIAIAFGGRVFPAAVARQGAGEARRRALVRFNAVLAEPFTTRIALTGLAIAVAVYFFLARSGNDSGMEISTLEWNFRAAMEKLFLTRPRTKELFIGMPAMIFAAFFAMRRQPVLALGATVAATIGIADIVNTFCHFWTPLFYSLLRTFHAFWLGGLLGGAAVWVWMKCEGALFGRMRSVSPLHPAQATAHRTDAAPTNAAPPNVSPPVDLAPTNGNAAMNAEPSAANGAAEVAPRGPTTTLRR